MLSLTNLSLLFLRLLPLCLPPFTQPPSPPAPPLPMAESGLGSLADLSCSGPVVTSAAPSCTLKHQLVNQTSASSSERFAAGVKPHRRFLPLTALVRTLQRHTANHIPNRNHNRKPVESPGAGPHTEPIQKLRTFLGQPACFALIS